MGKKVFAVVEEKTTYEQLQLHNRILSEENERLQQDLENTKTALRVLSSMVQELAR